MAYLAEERETLINYNEKDNLWEYETTVRKHISQIMKRADMFSNIETETEDGRIICVRATHTDLESFSVNPWPKKKPALSKEQRQAMSERLRNARR